MKTLLKWFKPNGINSSRRSFLKTTGVVAAVVVVPSPFLSLFRNRSTWPQIEPIKHKSRRKQTDAEREEIIARALETPEGRAALAMAMVAPIKTCLEYKKMGRQLIVVSPIERDSWLREAA